MHKKTPLEPANRELEITLIRIARLLYNFVDSQEDSKAIASIDLLLGEFQSLANDYVNRTGRLHDDLGFELREWASFKSELLVPAHEARVTEGKSNIDRRFVDSYRETPEAIISGLERQLGISE
jgi:hypothetical protein